MLDDSMDYDWFNIMKYLLESIGRNTAIALAQKSLG